ncbi:hypothetical protein DM860_000834 [Cuscuta australis]|uniref:F-box protein At3g26010-like beta-propeller domain-containing protein n=1 Tax=Cuscuta australis TaxID=267555 RepID=A0A328CZL8_9ASTE|nr:hypothetical protein DM860_000834 [Cuscuta australis]
MFRSDSDSQGSLDKKKKKKRMKLSSSESNGSLDEKKEKKRSKLSSSESKGSLDDKKKKKRLKSSSSSDSSHHHHLHHPLFFDGLSEGLLIEILIRVPSSREANQLKLVCKRWNSLISSPYFITFFNHHRHDPCLRPFPPDDSSHSVVCRLGHEIWLVRYRHPDRNTIEFDASHVLDFSFLPIPQTKDITVHCSCADLILCSYKSGNMTRSYFYVCNPLTKQWAALPDTYVDVYPFARGETVGLLCVPSPCSLCLHGGCKDHHRCAAVDNSRYKFTVVRILKCNPLLEPWKECSFEPVSEFNFELYSSEDGRWRSCMVTTPRALPRQVGAFSSLVAYRGKLHWLVDGHILVYDPYNSPTRFSRVIDIPPPHSYPDTFSSIGVRWDRLHVMTVSRDFSTMSARLADCNDHYIWELEDYDTGRWSLAHKFRARSPFPCVPEELVYVRGDTNPQPQGGETRFSELGWQAHAYYSSFQLHTKIVNQWWPTPVLPLPRGTGIAQLRMIEALLRISKKMRKDERRR